MGGRSKATLFLMEQLVVIAVFAICASVCVYILAISYLMTVDSVDKRNALLVAESAAESHKAFGGDLNQIARIIYGYDTLVDLSFQSGLRVYYCSDWQPIDEDLADFVLCLEHKSIESSVLLTDITVSRLLTSDELVSLTVGARRTK